MRSKPVARKFLSDAGSNSSQVSGGGMLLPEGVEVRGSRGAGGIWAKSALPRGTRYGPLSPFTSSHHPYNLEERLHMGNGYLEQEQDDWMRCVRSSASDLFNLRPVLDSGLMYFETTEEIKPGEELILGPKEFFRPADSSMDDKDTGCSQNSGDDKEDDEDYPRCPACDTPFQDSDLLDEHLVKKHRYESGQHRCEACGRGYAWRPCLTRHRSVAHGAPSRRYPCENCPKAFSDPSNLQRHIRSRHAGARSHACTECGKTFATSSGLKQHTHIHSSVKPFQCEVCYKAYTQFSNLCRHKRMHVSCRMQSKCNKCGQTFSTGTSLSKHKRFCDSSSGVNMNSLPPGGSSPFLLYPPRPGLPFYPPGLVPPYSGLFHSPTAPPPTFLSNSLIFASHHKSSEDESINNCNKISTMHRMRTESNSTCSPVGSPEQSGSPIHDSPTPSNSFLLMNKVSPPTAEEAVSGERPSPARPPMSATYPNPKTNIPSFVEPKEETSPLSSKRPYKCESTDQPLDLSVSKKDDPQPDSPLRSSKRSREPSPVNSEPSENSEEEIEPDTPTKRSTPEPARDPSPLPLTPKKELETSETPQEESPSLQAEPLTLKPISDLKETLEKSDSENNNRMPMAYPRPIHPLFLEALYRPPFPSFGREPASAEQVFSQNPFGVRPPFPFLGHLMNGMTRQARSFEMMRPPMPSFPNKNFQEGIAANGQKIKDRYACKFCGKVFPRSANLTRHLRTHTGEQPYKCPYCERSFSISSNLQRHIRNIHNKEKPFKCSLCDRCFGQQTNLDRHIKKHSSEDGIISVEDSPDNSNENDREDTYFDEIRSFMGKVTYGGGPEQMYPPSSVYHPTLSSSKDDDESSDTSLSPSYHKQDLPLSMVIPKHLSSSCKDEPLLNNNDQQEPLHIST